MAKTFSHYSCPHGYEKRGDLDQLPCPKCGKKLKCQTCRQCVTFYPQPWLTQRGPVVERKCVKCEKYYQVLGGRFGHLESCEGFQATQDRCPLCVIKVSKDLNLLPRDPKEDPAVVAD